MGVNKGGIEDYFHFNRQTSSIVMPDRDVLLFWTDYMKTSSASSQLHLTDFDGNVDLTMNEDITGRNVLLYGRVNNSEIVGVNASSSSSGENQICPGTVIPFTNGTTLFPFLNVFDYSISFDKTSNMFTLVFWCNMNDDFNGTYYDVGAVYEEYKETSENSGIWDWRVVGLTGTSTTNIAKRHMFVATGTLKKYKITSGGYSGTDNNGWNFIPIFNQPKKINLNNEYDSMTSYPVYPRVYQVVSVGTNQAIVKPITSGGSLIEYPIDVKTLPEA